MGAPLQEGLRLVHNTLMGVNLRDHTRIGAWGKVISAFGVARAIAIGADWCNNARGFMFALSCIQVQTCHTEQCPTEVITQDPSAPGRAAGRPGGAAQGVSDPSLSRSLNSLDALPAT